MKSKKMIALASIFGFWLLIIGCQQPVSSLLDGAGDRALGPVNLAVTPANNQLTLTWEPVEAAEGYQVLVSDGETEQTFEVMVPKRIVKDLVNGALYFCYVRAKINGVYGEWSNVVEAKPYAPTVAPTAPAVSVIRADKSLEVAWEATPGATTYQLYLNNEMVQETDKLEYIVQDLTNDQAYTVTIKAVNEVGTSPYSEPVTRAPHRYIKNSNVGFGLNVFQGLNAAAISVAPILDINKLNALDAIVVQDETKSVIYVATGEQIIDVQSKSNTSMGVSVSGQFKGIMASGAWAEAFAAESSERKETKYGSIRIEHNILRISLAHSFRDIYNLKELFTEGFLYALTHLSAAEIFQRYGYVVILSENLGANRELFYKYNNTKNSSLTEFSRDFNASVGTIAKNMNAEAHLESDSSTSTNFWQEDSILVARSDGGKLGIFFTLEDFMADAASWTSSVYETPVFSGIPSFSSSTIPLWEIAESLGEFEIANELYVEFCETAVELASENEAKLPGEWFKDRGISLVYEESGTYTQAKQYINTKNGQVSAPIRVVVSATSGGSGGQGHGGAASFEYAGGGGASGSVFSFSFTTFDDILLDMTIGKGGSRGADCVNLGSSYARMGYPGGDGQNTTVTWSSITLTANHGKGGGIGGGPTNTIKKPNGDNRGGVPGKATISNFSLDLVKKYKFAYELRDGNPGQRGNNPYKPGSGGQAVILNGFRGAAGGNGETANGEDGRVEIRLYSYMGE